ncbi:DUF2391 domain-containing protein [Haloarculaceae archaeon H-GB1-1]|nr:DUF2391 domain-containing protein [Haloarculaceae archaeon H-GB1-1]
MPDSDERHDERVDGGTRTRDDERATGDVDVDDLLADLEALATEVDSHAERQRVRQSIRLARRVDADDGVFDQYIRKYTRDDVAESFAGAVLFSIPLLVEDGVSAIAGHFLSATVAGFPLYYAGNVAFVFVLVSGVLYWSDIQNVEVYRPLFGVVPRRLVGVLVVSFLTAAVLLTLWGRVGAWRQPDVALARIVVVWTVASLGASLGDILPGESDKPDINDELAEFVDALD